MSVNDRKTRLYLELSATNLDDFERDSATPSCDLRLILILPAWRWRLMKRTDFTPPASKSAISQIQEKEYCRRAGTLSRIA